MIKRILRLFLFLVSIFGLPLQAVDAAIIGQDAQGKDIFFTAECICDYPDYKHLFVEYATKHLTDSSLEMHALYWLAYSYRYSSVLDPLVQGLVKGIEDTSITADRLDYLYQSFFYSYLSDQQKQIITAAVRQRWKPKSVVSLTMIDVLIADKLLPTSHQAGFPQLADTHVYEACQNEHYGTQTEYHCFNNLRNVLQFIISSLGNYKKPHVKDLLLQAFHQEIEECKKGRYVFWHGRDYGWDYCAYVYKQLYNLKFCPKHRADIDYIFLRFDDSKTQFTGVFTHDALYMNGSLFGNSKDLGSSSMYYILNNCDNADGLQHSKFTTEYLFSRFSLGQMYTKYKDDFKKLQQLHRDANLSKIGNLLLISLDEEHSNLVYSAGGYAYEKIPMDVGNGQKTTSAKEIIHALKENRLADADGVQYVLPLTKEYALNPKEGLKIYSFNAVDPVAYKKFQDFGDQLFANIAKDLKAEKLAKQAAALHS